MTKQLPIALFKIIVFCGALAFICMYFFGSFHPNGAGGTLLYIFVRCCIVATLAGMLRKKQFADAGTDPLSAFILALAIVISIYLSNWIVLLIKYPISETGEIITSIFLRFLTINFWISNIVPLLLGFYLLRRGKPITKDTFFNSR